jgi:hypothetical protein
MFNSDMPNCHMCCSKLTEFVRIWVCPSMPSPPGSPGGSKASGSKGSPKNGSKK